MSLRPKKRRPVKKSFKRAMNKWLIQSHNEGRLDTYSTPRIIAMRYDLSPVESEEAYYVWLRKKGYKQVNTYRKNEPIDAKCPKCDRKLSTSMDYHQLYCPEHKFMDAVECGVVPTRPNERIQVKPRRK